MTMTPINPRLILDRLKNKTLVRREWGDGHETACLIAAIHPACAKEKSAAVCPATLMPEWLAKLTTWMGDAPSAEAWHGLMERYADLASRWWRLSADAWTRLDYTCRRIAVAEARMHAGDDAKVLAVIDCVLALLDRAIAGDMPTADEWAAARAAAREAWAAAAAAAEVAAWAAARAAWEAEAWAAEEAAWAAAAVAARAARSWAAEEAARAAAARAARAGTAARAAARASARARAARRRAAADRMVSAMLDAIEAEIVAAEAA